MNQRPDCYAIKPVPDDETGEARRTLVAGERYDADMDEQGRLINIRPAAPFPVQGRKGACAYVVVSVDHLTRRVTFDTE